MRFWSRKSAPPPVAEPMRRASAVLSGAMEAVPAFVWQEPHALRQELEQAMSAPPEVFKLNLHPMKTIEAIDFVAREWPGVTQYYMGKVLYFADRDHCLDWGRTITGDRYVAMEHGPVPSRVYDLLKTGSGEDDELVDHVAARVTMEPDGNKVRVRSRCAGEFNSLSESDIGCLKSSLALCRSLTFSQLRDIVHAELPWQKAIEENNNAPPMDLTLWFEQAHLNREAAGVYLREHAQFGTSQQT